MKSKEDVARSYIAKDYLSEIRETYTYTDRVNFLSFTEIPHPVSDSEGLIREKTESNIKESLHAPGKKVTIIDPIDLNKIQHDMKNLEASYVSKSKSLEKNKIRMSDLKKMMIDQNEEWKSRQEEWRKQEKSNLSTISELKNQISAQKEIFEEQKQWMNFQINEKNKEIKVLKEEVKKKEEIIRDLKKSQKEIIEDDSLEVVELKPWKQNIKLPKAAKGLKRDTFLGFKHTVFDKDYPRENQENYLRRFAYEGDNENLQTLLQRDKALVNGRGMPDSLGSTVRSWQDKTALMLASEGGHFNCVKTLLEYGADPNYLDRDNLTALDYAQQKWHKNICDILREHEALNGLDLIDKIEASSELELTITV